MKCLDSQLRLLFLFALLIPVLSCTSNPELIRFESNGNSIIFTKKDIARVSLENDAAGKIFANLVLSNRGQQSLSTFTNKNINNTLTVISNNHVLMKDISIRDKITAKSIPFAFDSDQAAKDFVATIKSGL